MINFREVRVSWKTIWRVVKALRKGEWLTGPYIAKVEEKMRDATSSEYAIAVNSGTTALEVAFGALGICPGHKVLVPDLTFISCVNVIKHAGAIPVYCDVDKNTFVITKELVRKCFDKHPDIACILAVDLGGVEVEDLSEFDVPVVYDSAHMISKHRGAISCYSFYPSKVIPGIDGGCVVTNEHVLAHRANVLRNFGFEPGTRASSGISGFKGCMTNISAIVINEGLDKLQRILQKRDYIRFWYNVVFGINNRGLGMYMVKVLAPYEIMHLAQKQGIDIKQHYPKTLSAMFNTDAQNENATYLTKTLVSLPFHEYMTLKDIKKVCKLVRPVLIHNLE